MGAVDTPRQRFLTALYGGQPDRVPTYDFLFSQALFNHFLGQQDAAYTTEGLVKVAWALELDAVAIGMGTQPTQTDPALPSDCYRDEWGVVCRHVPGVSWPGDPPVASPVANREDWRNYAMPDPELDLRLREIRIAKRMVRNGSLAVTGIAVGPYTAAWQILGLENLSLLLYDDPGLISDVLRAVTDFYVRIGERMAGEGVDALWIADDLGNANGPFMSPRHFRQYVLPHIRRMVHAFRSRGVPVILHCDGDVRLLMDDLVATGIQAYHPVERAAHMDLATCKQRYGGHLCLIGNVDNKGLLVNGTPDEVEAQVLECLRIAAPGGGYVLASDHSLHDDIALENVLAMFEAARRYGNYATREWEPR